MNRVIHPLNRAIRRLRSNYLLAISGSLLTALLIVGNTSVQAQTCTSTAGFAHWNFDNANDNEIDNSSGIPPSGGSGCVGKVLKRVDGGSNSVYNNTPGDVDSDYGPVCKSKKSICTGTWDKAAVFERYISVYITYPKGVKGKLSGITFCEMAMARTKASGGFGNNNRPENYRVRLRKRVNGGSWSVVWTGSARPTTKTDWTGSSSNPVPPTGWGSYNSDSDGFTTQSTDGTAEVEFEFQLSAYQNSDSNSSQEIWEIDEVDIEGCCDPAVCSPTNKLVEWDFDNASDNQIDNSSGIPASGGSYSGCASVVFKRTDGGSNSVYKADENSGDYGPVCASDRSICTGTWDSSTPFERKLILRITFPAGKAGRLYGLSFCEMAMNKTKSGGGFVTNNQPEYYKVRLKKNGTIIWTGSVKSTTKTTWSSSSDPAPTGWGNYNSSSDGFPTQTTSGSAEAVFEFEITAYQSSDSDKSQEIWDLDELKVFGCCDDACVTPAKPSAVDVPRCGPGSVNLKATGCTTGTLHWYATSTSTTILGTGPTFTTPSLTATEDYYVSCVDGLCESGRDVARAIVNAIPAKPTGVGASRCGPGAVTLTATGCTGTLSWYAGPSGGASLGTGSSFTTPSLAATTTYYVNCVSSASCQSTRAAAVATIQTCDCDISITATRGDCDATTNQYTVTGVISLTNTAGGTATITDGSVTTTVTIAAGATSVPYTLTGLNSNGAVHTISVNLPNCGTDAKSYTAPAECKKVCPTGNCFETIIRKN
ncbi:immunoglobulin domain-containing protein [Spirosoma fluviale]|nr:hypothetical protein [Spirosoma fluviale]